MDSTFTAARITCLATDVVCPALLATVHMLRGLSPRHQAITKSKKAKEVQALIKQHENDVEELKVQNAGLLNNLSEVLRRAPHRALRRRAPSKAGPLLWPWRQG